MPRYLLGDVMLTIEQLRVAGWAHVLDLVAEGLADDGDVCRSEGWRETAVACQVSAEAVDELADVIRLRQAKAEELDRASGCE